MKGGESNVCVGRRALRGPSTTAVKACEVGLKRLFGVCRSLYAAVVQRHGHRTVCAATCAARRTDEIRADPGVSGEVDDVSCSTLANTILGVWRAESGARRPPFTYAFCTRALYVYSRPSPSLVIVVCAIMLSSRPMDPIIDHSSHDGTGQGKNDDFVHIATQAGQMRLQENEEAPGYHVVTPPPQQGDAAATGSTAAHAASSEVDQPSETTAAASVAAHHAAGLKKQASRIPGGGAELANAESLGGASHAAHSARITNLGNRSVERPGSAGRSTSSTDVSATTSSTYNAAITPAQPVGPGAAGLASARGVDTAESGAATPSQFVFPKLGARRPSENQQDGTRGLNTGASSPAPDAGSGSPSISTPPETVKHKKKEHLNPLHDLRRVSMTNEQTTHTVITLNLRLPAVLCL